MQGYRVSTLQPRGDIFPRKRGLHRLISTNEAHRYFAENLGIRIAQVTAGTRCYISTPADATLPDTEL